MIIESNLVALKAAMESCEQTKSVSVLAHGHSVNSYFWDLIDHLYLGKELKYEWRLPEWTTNKDLLFRVLDVDSDIIENYLVYHDCGKPYCVTTDDEGKRHFPNHAKMSAETWRTVSDNALEADLMMHDMDIHLLKAAGIPEFMKFEHWPVLLLAGLSEVHSNAAMFGGIGSTSFKMKWKQLNKRGNAILKLSEKQDENV